MHKKVPPKTQPNKSTLATEKEQLKKLGKPLNQTNTGQFYRKYDATAFHLLCLAPEV